MKKVCFICSNIFEVRGKRKITAKFCSVKCKGISQLGNSAWWVNRDIVLTNSGRTRFKKEQVSEEKNSQWKGDSASYSAKHHWVTRKLGKAQKCEICGEFSLKNYQWANRSGQYKRDLTDYFQSCIPCHKRYDLRRISNA